MIDNHRLLQGIRNVSHFNGLSDDDLRAIIAAGSLQVHAAQTMIFLEGEPSSGMYVLLSGEVHLIKLGPQGQQDIVSVVHPVIMFNEVTVLDGGPNPLTAMAFQPCRVWRISTEAFQALLARYPQIGLSLLRILAFRNRMMIEHYHDLSFLPVLGRVAKLLLELSSNGEKTIQRRQTPVSQMAARISTVPEAVSRALKELRQQHAIEISRSEIVITRRDILANLAQVEF